MIRRFGAAGEVLAADPRLVVENGPGGGKVLELIDLEVALQRCIVSCV